MNQTRILFEMFYSNSCIRILNMMNSFVYFMILIAKKYLLSSFEYHTVRAYFIFKIKCTKKTNRLPSPITPSMSYLSLTERGIFFIFNIEIEKQERIC